MIYNNNSSSLRTTSARPVRFFSPKEKKKYPMPVLKNEYETQQPKSCKVK